MKSVTIKDKDGRVIIKVIHRKNGVYEIMIRRDQQDMGIKVEVRDHGNQKVMYRGRK